VSITLLTLNFGIGYFLLEKIIKKPKIDTYNKKIILLHKSHIESYTIKQLDKILIKIGSQVYPILKERCGSTVDYINRKYSK
jgi:hypothetical protein